MYDGFTGRYTLACPVRGEASVPLSAFRTLDRLAGPEHPAVFRVRFACPCGDDHDGLVAHDDLDWAPLGFRAGEFLNLMTARVEAVENELGDLTVRRIEAGEWPWSFFCFPEQRPRPVFPSAFRLIADGGRGVGVAVRCPVCDSVSVNLVSHEHVDLPFYNDGEVGVVDHVFREDALRTVEEFRAELYSASFDARRTLL